MNDVAFPELRRNEALAEAWDREVAALNGVYQFLSPGSVVDKIVEQRAWPCLPWPANWPRLARRMRTYSGDMIGIVGGQGGGKTSFAIQICLGALAAGIPVLWAPLELDREQIATRIAANLHGVHSYQVRDEWNRERIRNVLASGRPLALR